MQARLSFKYALRHKIVISDKSYKSLQYFIVGFHILIVGKVFDIYNYKIYFVIIFYMYL